MALPIKTPPVVFVVDDDSRVLQSLSRLLRSAGHEVRTFASPVDFLADAPRDRHGCVILDLRMPGMTGLELQDALRRRGDPLPIVFITGHGDVPASVQAMKAGAVDFLQKPFSADDLFAAIARALEKDAAARAARAEVTEVREAVATLSPREQEVARRVAAGMLSKQIAAELGLSEKTVAVHRSRVMEKLNVDSVAELVRLFARLEESPPR
ncbi:MAG: response regulator transcription factor [Polyangiaceae bacterium]|nr:response regulator transcription factor [Polyangiaceae bacterium]